MTKKRIVIDARESGTSTGRYIDKLLEHLHTLKPAHNIIVLTKAHRLDFIRKIAPTFEVIETPYKEFTFEEQWGFKKQIESLKPDLVHFGMIQQPILYRGRVVTTMHDLTTIRFRNPSKNQAVLFIKQQVYKWVNKRGARKSTLVLTPTEYVKQDVVSYTGIDESRVIVTLESADKIAEASIPYDSLLGKQFIMYTGQPMPHKNLGRLIDAFADIQTTMPDLYLGLVGKKDSNYEAHEKRVKEQGVKNVIFTGFITDGQLRWMYENTACYVLPSLSEGFSLTGLEAMIHGAPVASSNFTCLPEVYGDAAEYFDPTDVGGVEKSILTILTDKSRRDELIKLGHKQAAQYSWKRMAQQTLEAYKRALS